MPPTTSFLDPKVLAKISNLELLARTVVDGFLQGIHQSPHLGVSMEFAEHRAYMPGDDIRRIDWRLYARTDRFYIKQYEAETNTDLALVLDATGSMGFGSGPVTKLDYAKYLVASLAYFSAGQRDRVGLYAFTDHMAEHVRPSASHLNRVLHSLARLKPGKEGGWKDPIATVANTFHRRGVIAVVSDFYAEPEEVVTVLASLAARGHDMVAFHVLDESEIDFPFSQATRFQDLETSELLPVVPEKLATAYRDHIRNHIETLGTLFRKHDIDYVLLNTSKPLDDALYRYLSFRQKKARVR